MDIKTKKKTIVEGFTIELTVKEADTLFTLIGNIGGGYAHSMSSNRIYIDSMQFTEDVGQEIRALTDKIYDALKNAMEER